MRTNMIVILFMLLFNACAPIYSVDEAFFIYVKRFENLGNISVTNLRMEFSDLENLVVGRCQFDDVPSILIDKEYWNEASEHQKEELVFHELGHCVLDLDHRQNIKSNGCPESYMHDTTLPQWCLVMFQNEYRKEIFLK